MEQQELLRQIPQVDILLSRASELGLLDGAAQGAAREAIRAELEELRQKIRSGKIEEVPKTEALCRAAAARMAAADRSSLHRVINATGVVPHTNLGRACLSERAASAAEQAARSYSTLEYNVEEGCRGSRHSHTERLLTQVTGAEGAMAVNNNAAAVLLILSALGKGGEVIVSRGELVEIGGSFRIPEIMTQCGCTLREVGTTNKTHLEDYERAITPETRALLRVHTSNYRIVGFTEKPELAELVELGKKYGLPVIEDLGSGSLVDLAAFGIQDEPTVQQSVKAGVDVISFSGDKLLGGPQAGLILGKREFIERLKKHPLARALRVDKMTIAALQATLQAYQDTDRAREEIPVLQMLGAASEQLMEKAEQLCQMLSGSGYTAQVTETEGQVGGGSCPAQVLKSWAVAIVPEEMGVDELARVLRQAETPIVGRVSQGRYLLDVRTLSQEEFPAIARRMGEIFG